MNERWRRTEEIIQAALDLDTAERDAFVSKTCGDDAELRSEVQSLLQACGKADKFLDTPIMATGAVASPEIGAAKDDRPERIGNYRIINRLGAGGMGEVYLAERDDNQYSQRVALKIVKRGMDTDEILRRFRSERQTLANLSHANIARLLDGGATEHGRPYLVMEHIVGQPIDDYCRSRNLAIVQRLELFRIVCSAVEDAHRNLVVHRDLKPSNILVTADGTPKLLDFGIAKVLDRSALAAFTLTQVGMQLLTPEYASPEQFRGSAVSTATDVYSLGVVLYELLAGQRPYSLAGRSPREIEHIVCEREPPRPSTVIRTDVKSVHRQSQTPGDRQSDLHVFSLPSRRLRGDLDTIVLAALRKEPNRRYHSVEQLSEDIRRHLVGLPISARPDTLGYRTTKFIRRNRLLVAAGLLVMAALVGGIVTTAWQAGVAARERDAAQAAKLLAEENLWQAYLAQSRAARSSTLPGRRFDSLDVIARAAEIKPSLRLRNEAIACLALPDASVDKSFANYPNASALGLKTPHKFAYTPQPGEIRVVATEDGRELTQLSGAVHGVYALFFDLKGRFLVAKYRDQSIWVWDLENGRRVLLAETSPRNPEIAIDPNGKWIAILQADERVQFFHLPSGEVWKSMTLHERVFKLSPNSAGTKIVVSSLLKPYLQLWDIESGEAPSELRASAHVHRPAWSQDGQLLAASGQDGNIHIWDVERREVLKTLVGHQAAAVALFFDSEGERLTSWSWDNTSRLWDLHSGRTLLGPIQDWQVMGGDERFACVDQSGDLAVWRFSESDICRRIRTASPFRRPNISAESASGLLLSAGGNGVRLWDLATDRQRLVLSDEASTGAELLADGRTVIAAVGDGIRRWTIARRGKVLEIEDSTLLWSQEGINGLCLTPDQRNAIICYRENLVVVDMAQRKQVASWVAYAKVRTPVVSPDGRWLFTGTWKGPNARVWDLISHEEIQQFKGRHVRGCFSPDNHWFLVARKVSKLGRRFIRAIGTSQRAI